MATALVTSSSGGGGVAVCSIDGRLMYAVGGPAYLGPACVALGVGSGVSIVAFRDELCVFYPLDSALTFVGAGCAAVVAGGPSLGVCISPGRSFRLWRLRLLPFLGGCVLDAGGCGAPRL